MKKTTPASAEAMPENQAQQVIDRLRQVYRQNLIKHTTGRQALAGCHLTDQTVLERYQVGYSDGTLPELLPPDKVLQGQLETLGVLDSKGEERFASCAVFPVEGADGRRINLWAIPKEGSSRFLSKRPRTLWNAIAAKHASHLYVFTNPIEALSAATAGCSNIAALDPEAGAPDHRAIQGWGVQRISIIVPDTKEGLRQGDQIKAQLEPLAATLVKIPDCTSFNELLGRKGAKVLGEALVAAVHELPTMTIPGMELRADGFMLKIDGRSYRVRGLLSGTQKLTAGKLKGTG